MRTSVRFHTDFDKSLWNEISVPLLFFRYWFLFRSYLCHTYASTYTESVKYRFFSLGFKRMLLNPILEELLFSPQLKVYHHHQRMLFSIKDRTLFLLAWHILDSLFHILKPKYPTIWVRDIKNIQKMNRDPFLICIWRSFNS